MIQSPEWRRLLHQGPGLTLNGVKLITVFWFTWDLFHIFSAAKLSRGFECAQWQVASGWQGGLHVFVSASGLGTRWDVHCTETERHPFDSCRDKIERLTVERRFKSNVSKTFAGTCKQFSAADLISSDLQPQCRRDSLFTRHQHDSATRKPNNTLSQNGLSMDIFSILKRRTLVESKEIIFKSRYLDGTLVLTFLFLQFLFVASGTTQWIIMRNGSL